MGFRYKNANLYRNWGIFCELSIQVFASLYRKKIFLTSFRHTAFSWYNETHVTIKEGTLKVPFLCFFYYLFQINPAFKSAAFILLVISYGNYLFE